jgi:AraC family transcriptional regulator
MAAPQKLGLGEYFGASIRRRQASGFVVTENRFDPGLKIPDHEHAYAHFTLILEGGFSERYGDLAFDCPAGSMLLVPAGRVHSDEIWATGAHTVSVEMSTKLTARVNETTGVLREPSVLTGAQIQQRAARLQAEFHSVDPASLLALESIAMDILVMASRSQPKTDSDGPHWMPAVMHALHEHPRTSLSLGELSDLAGVHESHLARTFKRVHGCSIGEYVRWLRLEETKKDLRDTARTVADIGIDAGFYDQAHYSRAFRAAYGISPSGYRKTFRAG